MPPHDLPSFHFHDLHGVAELLPEEDEAVDDAIWAADNVELTTVGIDVGSSTSHVMFSRIHLQRLATNLSSRFVVVGRELLWESPIWLTPYRSGNLIDAGELGDRIHGAYRDAGMAQDGVDSGAVILTGEALRRANARAIAELFAGEAGKFVCASAGHNMEAMLAAHGSGAVALSRHDDRTVLNVDVGGGTAKLALAHEGEVIATAAIAVGGRLVATDSDGRMVRIEPPAEQVAASLQRTLTIGEPLSSELKRELAGALAEVLIAFIRGDSPSSLGSELLLTEPLDAALPRPDTIVFSGGVAEYLFDHESGDFGDMGHALATAIRAAIDAGRLPAPVLEPSERIRATAVGASQFSVQLSGNTIAVSHPELLPIHNLVVVRPHLPASGALNAPDVSGAIRESIARFDLAADTPVALAFAWDRDPFYADLRALADGIAGALPADESDAPLVLAFDTDLGRLVGNILREDVGVTRPVICIDGLELQEFDYIDVGAMIEPTHVVPVVIKSLVFAAGSTVGAGNRH
ncbi:MAG: ethanolamine utilization protein EutA [Chloroflexota bacterium]|nr:ethanolamine utilization protein EutA [Chloroflexota bacterium]